ncbi:zinc-finger homeodomain protein 7 [Phtheirospermum japonicum]|uniref:Zinc-finger homeodomain protein 7 n=1 Tax=Phtheirospermum japonicum TaxID=374723 RepID=A0A830DMA0_9LAMI|nr:zinc-finger homeodomain protein 7 [Phtheirospermum japonicum]
MYKECQHNYAAHDRAYILDGCCLFEPSGPNGTPGSTVCVACNCHRSFHRRVEVELPRVTRHQNDDYGPVPPHQPISGITDLPPRPQVHVAPVRPMQDLNRPRVHRPTGLAPIFGRQQQGMEAGPGEHRKRLTGEKSERLRAICERNNWKTFCEYSRDEVAEICSEIGIERAMLKAWIAYHRDVQAPRQ